MTKMKTLSCLAVSLMLTGVLAACGSDKAASPDSQSNAEEAIENIPAAADNDAHPTNETDIEIDEEAAESPDTGTATESTDLDVTTTDDSDAAAGSGSTDNSSSGSTDSSSASSPSTDAATDSSAAGTKSEGTADSSKGSAPAAAKEQSGEGTYSGLADNHTAEIEVDGKPVSYQLSEEAQKQVGQIPADAEVTFTYTEEQFDADTTVITITDIKEAK
ncbi:hypothetical protein [Saccharibacillus alkalitolerans]|uniref:Uncharacterized protein n=1 Tax=Saccharibacillus alkalitolerans TaxID=2705290 RepID=A0ABX0F4J2_9BACL|nr:hypothetical protein [Saccharibacillus alkalitolerans]NGZ74919.1 hypothetical protein [Saccharibacillus alkalitolerans]